MFVSVWYNVFTIHQHTQIYTNTSIYATSREVKEEKTDLVK